MWDQPHDRERRDALAAAGLAHDAERLALTDLERDVIDGIDNPGPSEEMRLQVPDIEDRIVILAFVHLASSLLVVALRIERVTKTIAQEGEAQHRQTNRQDREEKHVRIGANVLRLTRVPTIWPQLACGGRMPTPTKLSAASVKIAAGTPKVAATMIGVRLLGSRCCR